MRTVVGGYTRAGFGLIVSAASEDYSRRFTVHRVGLPTVELPSVCAEIDRLEGRWYIEAISTPDSVFRDVTGTQSAAHYNERQLLTRCGRLDLLRVPLERGELDSTKQIGHAWRGRRLLPRRAR